jgi:hypothetical protein
MTTPWRDLVLVHAVQRPLVEPDLDLVTDDEPQFAGLSVLARGRGQTAAYLRGRLVFDLPSTAQVDLAAGWDDCLDDPDQTYADQDAMVHPVRKQILTVAVPEPFGTPWQPEVAPLVEPLDGKGAAFRSRGPEGDSPEDRRRQLLAAAAAAGLTAPQRRRLEAAAAQLEQLRAHEFGDTRYRRVSYQPVASTRFREYFDPAMPAADGTATGQPRTVDVLSSAPPAKPAVLQVLPLLAYDQSRTDDVTSSRRQGLGLRVWLARPWFSSGAGEFLAVVCDRGGPLTADSELSREITVITGDPVHGSPLPLPLRAQSFRNPDLIRRDVPLAEGPTRDIAAFAPIWDAGRQAWYCDLQFDTGEAYFPFVRLALARYQPFALPGCELSPLVPTAFVQTLPDRTLTCTHGAGELTVSVTGPAPTSTTDLAGAGHPGGNEVVAVVEVQPDAFGDPLLGWTALGPETVLSVAAIAAPTATYSGTVPIPDAPGQRRRLVVREFEHHPADDRTADPAPGLVLVRRLVHVDVVPL